MKYEGRKHMREKKCTFGGGGGVVVADCKSNDRGMSN